MGASSRRVYVPELAASVSFFCARLPQSPVHPGQKQRGACETEELAHLPHIYSHLSHIYLNHRSDLSSPWSAEALEEVGSSVVC